MAAKSNLLAILLIALVLTPSLVFARDLETTSKVAVNQAPLLRAVLGQALDDACVWCLVGRTYCCGNLLHCCGSWCCRNPCCGNRCC